ncbi:Flp1 family type IVb pilin [Paenibacillus sp. CMAA1739]|uniref:Flp1 family type IVb pilin n=1 Tax=Paenibacillus ottowii TaxID=2315729 RepID=UPI002730ED64|nr:MULTISPECIES: Flp1 family type IVb pilin [Paenibacillus]MDP1509660.1 Flp1 family type IVb pilin [Paenibacillus ottowii]MEC4566876.1 Flp1 family type IVb pilin [Paenibacillus sp. CMAA1739]
MMTILVAGSIRKLYKDEDGLGTLEMILIIAILIAVAIIFKDQIKKIVEGLLKKADKKSNDFMDS